MYKTGLMLALLTVTVVAFAQVPTGEIKAKPYVPRKIVMSPQPVTKTEAGKVFAQAGSAIAKVMPTLKAPSERLAGTKPVTREEVIGQFDKLFQMAKPEFKFTPKKVSYDATLLTIKDPAARAKLQNLIAWGCVDKVGYLATANKGTLGVTEFGDSVGFLLSRLAELTHMPDPEFTPDLQP